MAPKEEGSIDPFLRLNGRSVDLTNLFPNGKVPETFLQQQTEVSRCRPRKQATPEPSLYPDLKHILEESMYHVEPASEAFRKAAVRSRTTNQEPTSSQPGAFLSRPNDGVTYGRNPQSPGAFNSFYSTSRPKPPLPSWVEELPNDLQDKMKNKCVISDESSSMPSSSYYIPSQMPNVPSVDIFRQESILSEGSTFSTTTNPISRMEDDDDDTITATTALPPLKIEVAPGHFLPLRGSAETLAAVESGMARTVTCLACQARLCCVPDAELVICPDCRLVSPLAPASNNNDWHGHSRTKQYYGSDTTQPGVQYQVGGVGLGLKI